MVPDSHRKLKYSIFVGSALVHPAKDLLLNLSIQIAALEFWILKGRWLIHIHTYKSRTVSYSRAKHNWLCFYSLFWSKQLFRAERGCYHTGWPINLWTILGGHCEVMDWFRKKNFNEKKCLNCKCFPHRKCRKSLCCNMFPVICTCILWGLHVYTRNPCNFSL